MNISEYKRQRLKVVNKDERGVLVAEYISDERK